MISSVQSPIVTVSCQILAGIIQIFALYVIFHGHYSPGGGFQGGALLAASVLLLRMSGGIEESQTSFKSSFGTPLGAQGVLIYTLIGVFAILGGGNFLDYAFVAWPGFEGAARRSFNILLIELGVALAVMATLISIFDDLANAKTDDA